MPQGSATDLLERARRASAVAKTQWKFRKQLEDRARRRVWLPKDVDDEIPYGELRGAHLVNILLMLRRSAQKKAQAAADLEHLELGPGGWRIRRHPQWDGLVAEARSRGGQVAAAADLIDSDRRLDEAIIRAGVGTR